MAETEPSRTGRARGVGLTHAALVLVILVLAAAVALVTPPPSPPAAAELSPSSRQATAEPEPETPTPTPEADQPENPYAGIDRSRVRPCVGDPPRQTEDPMSPPCVAYWDGKDNGGATAKGVTKTQINIVMPGGIAQLDKGINGIVQHFNSRYEFYGRKLNVEFLTTGEWLEQLNPAQYAAYAEQMDTELNAFAVMSAGGGDGSATTLYDLLAERGIISVDVGAGFRTEEQLNRSEYADYQWAFYMTDDVMQQNFAEWACENLVGNPAIHAGSELKDTTRRFGVIQQRNATGGVSHDASVLVSALEACDAPIVGPDQVTFEWGAEPPVPTAKTALAKLRSQGVTSVICVCTNQFLTQTMPAAEELSWHPEWVSPGTGFQADANLAAFWPPGQREHFFGPSLTQKVNSYTYEPWFAAAREGDPTITAAWMQGQHSNWGLSLEEMYSSLLIIASGIQGAGPNLTPERFAAALRGMEFPNPGAGGPPYYQPRVGFGVGDHSFVEDATLVYFDPTVRPYDDPQLGTFCYLGHGRRYGLGDWPANTDERFYPEGRPPDVPCR